MTETHPEKRFIGYVRVSTYGQTLEAQPEQLRAVRADLNPHSLDDASILGAFKTVFA